MSRIYHKPHAKPHETEIQRIERESTQQATDLAAAMDKSHWLYLLGYWTMALLGLVGGVLVVLVRGPLAMAGGGVLLVVAGFLEIIISPGLTRARNSRPTWLRFMEEGWSGLVDVGAGTFRFVGSALVGWGCGAFIYGLAPYKVVAVAVGLVVGLAIWIWTWSVFPGFDD